MSFEGYYQILCEQGHYSYSDAHSFSPEKWECSICKGKHKWSNLVDTTNGSFDENNERIDGFIELTPKKQPVYCTCKGCGIRHIKEEATYEIPKRTKK